MDACRHCLRPLDEPLPWGDHTTVCAAIAADPKFIFLADGTVALVDWLFARPGLAEFGASA